MINYYLVSERIVNISYPGYDMYPYLPCFEDASIEFDDNIILEGSTATDGVRIHLPYANPLECEIWDHGFRLENDRGLHTVEVYPLDGQDRPFSIVLDLDSAANFWTSRGAFKDIAKAAFARLDSSTQIETLPELIQ